MVSENPRERVVDGYPPPGGAETWPTQDMVVGTDVRRVPAYGTGVSIADTVLPVRNRVQVRVNLGVNSALSGRSGTSFGIISGVGKIPGLFFTTGSISGHEAALLLAKLMKLLFLAATSGRNM